MKKSCWTLAINITMRISGMWVENKIFFVGSTKNGDIRVRYPKNKSMGVFLITKDVINVSMYDENANYASFSGIPTLANTLLGPMLHSFFSGNSSMSRLESALRISQPFYFGVSREKNGIKKNPNPSHWPISVSKQWGLCRY